MMVLEFNAVLRLKDREIAPLEKKRNVMLAGEFNEPRFSAQIVGDKMRSFICTSNYCCIIITRRRRRHRLAMLLVPLENN